MHPLLRALPLNLALLALTHVIALGCVQADGELGLPAFGYTAVLAVGALLVGLGMGLRLWATITYHEHELAVLRLLPQRRLVSAGPFAHVRNPLLQGWWLLQAGWGLVLGTPSGLLFTLAMWVVLDFWVKWEELTLAAEFGDEYTASRTRAPRWGWRR